MQITALALTLIAAIFLAKGGLGLGPQVVAELASTKFNYNSDVVSALSQQHADTSAGAGLLLLAFFLQVVNVCWPMQWKHFIVHRPTVIYAIIFSVLIGAVTHYASQQYARATEARVMVILEAPASVEPKAPPPSP